MLELKFARSKVPKGDEVELKVFKEGFLKQLGLRLPLLCLQVMAIVSCLLAHHAG